MGYGTKKPSSKGKGSKGGKKVHCGPVDLAAYGAA